jgi:hypothetical protein
MRLAVLCILSIALQSTGAWATTHHVPGEYATIQAGVDAASAGDTVLVAPGVYSSFEVRSGQFGPVSACVFVKDGAVLRSEGGPAVTAIDRNWIDTPESAFTLHGHSLATDQTVIEGFRRRRPESCGKTEVA